MSTLPRLPGPCFYCGSPGPIQADHWVPRSRGGSNSILNLVPACYLCNQDKSDMTPAEWITYRLRNGLSWPPGWTHDQCERAWDWHHHCIDEGRIVLKMPNDLVDASTEARFGPWRQTPSKGLCKALQRWLKYTTYISRKVSTSA